MAQLVDYTLQHDAVLAFYYTNEQTNVCALCLRCVINLVNFSKWRCARSSTCRTRDFRAAILVVVVRGECAQQPLQQRWWNRTRGRSRAHRACSNRPLSRQGRPRIRDCR